MKESLREFKEEYRLPAVGRNANGGFVRGGVKSGVGGLLWVTGVPGAECASGATTAYLGSGAVIGWFPEDWRECVGGVGGNFGGPILLDACFNVRGLDEVSELLGIDETPVSIESSRGFSVGGTYR